MCYQILVILVVLLVLLRFVPHSYGNEGFQSTTSVVICKAEWCGHCKQAAPEFQKLVSASPIALSNGNSATVTMLDADADKAAIAPYKVRGYPTILVMKDGEKTEYPGERTYDAVVQYLNTL